MRPLFTLLFLASLSAPTFAQTFTILTDGTPFSGDRNNIHALSSDGSTVTGTISETDSGGSFVALRTYVWTADGGFRFLPFEAGETGASATRNDIPVNQDGSVVGVWVYVNEDTPQEEQRLLIWRPGQSRTELTVPRGRFNGFSELGISGDGTVLVGRIGEDGPIFENTPDRAVRWDNGAGAVLPIGDFFETRPRAASPNGQTVVGLARAEDGGSSIAVRWTNAGIQRLFPEDPTILSSSAVAINGAGQIVTNFRREVNGERVAWGAIWSPGGMFVELPVGGGGIKAISADGRTVAGSNGLWTEETGWRDTRTVLEDAGLGGDIANLTNLFIEDMSADGRTIVGFFRRPGGPVDDGFIATLGQPLVITTTGDQEDADDGDGACDVDTSLSGNQCTLRAAIQTANARPGRDSISVNIPGAGPHRIAVSSSLPALTGPLVLDATTQPGYDGTPRVEVSGTGAISGFVLDQGESTLRGLAIGGFSVGVAMSGPEGNRLEASRVGLTPGGLANPNQIGVLISNSPGHIIGGTDAEQQNVISGNTGPGVQVTGATSTGIVIAGNRIGTDAAGTAALANGAEGVLVENAPRVRIGGSMEAERNLIAGNGTHGVRITGAEADGVQVLGNWIGLAADGTTALPNGTDATAQTGHHGVTVVSAPNAVIGGETATAGASPGNVIAASAAHGVYVTGTPDAPADGARVLGNLIGTDRTGGTARVNGAAAVYVTGAARNARIGEAGAGNGIVAGTSGDGNSRFGVALFGLAETEGQPDNATIAANTIGLSANGNTLLGNLSTAVIVATTVDEGGVQGVTIGGAETGDGNRIAGQGIGVGVLGPRSAGTIVATNTIGLKANGQLASNERAVLGIWIVVANGSQVVSNVVAGHLIGIVVTADDVALLGNRVGTNPNGTQARPNTVGIYVPGEIENGPDVGDRTQIGAEGAGNLVSGNQNDGIRIGGDFIGGEVETFRLGGAGGVAEQVQARAEAGGMAAMKAALARPSRAPLERKGSRSPDSLVIAFNRVGTTRNGRQQLGNGRSATEENAFPGIWIRDGRGTRVLGNVVGGNGFGVLLLADEDYGGNPREVTIAGSLIGSRADLSGSIPNQFGGVAIIASEGNTLTAAPLTSGGDPVGNIVRRNGSFGVIVRPVEGERGNKIRGTSFLDSQGPSIELLNGDLEYPAVAPMPPEILSAVQTDEGARLRFSAGTAGAVDVFASGRCDDGNAEGVVIASAEVAAGLARVPVTSLPNEAEPRDLYLALSLTETTATGSTSSLSECVRIADASDVVEAPVEANETGLVVDDVEIEVDLVENPNVARGRGGGGLLVVSRYGEQIPPIPGPFEGSTTAPDGSTVTPNVVSSDRHWALRAIGLQGVTYNVCIQGAGISGVGDPDQLVVVQRETPSDPWTPFPSTRDGGTLCATGLSTWGEIGIGGDETVNPVPNEPEPEVLPSRLAVAAYPNPTQGRATVRLALPAAGHVHATVHDALGREVAVLHEDALAAGEHEMPLPRLAPGLYVIRVLSATATASAAVTVVR
ncbi:MAG: T9SS type A sorting domain-containing protein [Bacteroidota bacterium]